MRTLSLTLMPGSLAVCRLGPDEPVPVWAWGGPLAAVVRTPEELSVVCAESAVPDGVRCERGWRAFQVAGPFAFSEVGVVASLVGPLADAGVSVFVLSTFDTDYLLIRGQQLDAAHTALTVAGHQVDAPA